MIWKDGDNVQVELWKNFIKRKNSTKIPASAGQTLEVALKDATSIEIRPLLFPVMNSNIIILKR